MSDADSANDIIKNGLNKEYIGQKTSVTNQEGFFVTDDIGMAKDYAGMRTKYEGGVILVFSDDIVEFLEGSGTKNNEAFIPFDCFDKMDIRSFIIDTLPLG